MFVLDFMKTRNGIILISIVWGLGLAAMFRTVCVGKNCVVVKAPDASEIKNTIYSFGDEKCYKFKPISSECTKESVSY